MKSNVLQERLKELGWTRYRLAQELAKFRGDGKEAQKLASTVTKVVNDPEKCNVSTLNDLIKALGGELIIRWQKTEVVVIDTEEVKLSD